MPMVDGAYVETDGGGMGGGLTPRELRAHVRAVQHADALGLNKAAITGRPATPTHTHTHTHTPRSSWTCSGACARLPPPGHAPGREGYTERILPPEE